MSKKVKDVVYDAFMKSGDIGYYMLYSALTRKDKDDGQ